MKCRAFLCLCSLLLPWATSLATSATSEPEYIQGHQIKRLIGSLIEVEGWTGKIPMSNVFYVWKREPVKERLNRGIWLAITVGRTQPDLKTAFSMANDKYKNISTEADHYVYDCRRNRAKVIERVRTTVPFKSGEKVFQSTDAKTLPFNGEWIHFDGNVLDATKSHLDARYMRAELEIMWEETCGRVQRE